LWVGKICGQVVDIGDVTLLVRVGPDVEKLHGLDYLVHKAGIHGNIMVMMKGREDVNPDH